MEKPAATERPCPICGQPSVRAFRPFCSRRCADVDLHRWLAGRYVIPASDDEADDDVEAPALVPRPPRRDDEAQ
ncbi:MAG: DNA gyrase inhibitor YacG [Variibacter sp.]|nr:DNA gyrase inhibitor YacG [Variibacter sp.]